VFAATLTKLRELETASGRFLVLRRRVVALLALAALQSDNFPHLFILPDFPGIFARSGCIPAAKARTDENPLFSICSGGGSSFPMTRFPVFS
jgi:hypothetical protein